MSGAPLLEVHGLKRSFGDRAIIHGISFTVHASDILFVRGASGVGKSLLLRALAYLDPIQVHIVLAPYSSSYRARPARSATEEDAWLHWPAGRDTVSCMQLRVTLKSTSFCSGCGRAARCS